MKSLMLISILLVSHRDQRARKVNFHPRVTLIKGTNDTGKSSLIKSIYHAFGTEPHSIHYRWKNADVISLVTFELDGDRYSIYRHRKSFSLFDSKEELIGTYHSVTNELAPALADLFNFKLKLIDRQNQSASPPPAYLLLPFYIDQDKGWVSTWCSFQNLGQFPNWKKRVISYHYGIRPDKWYELEAEKKAQVLAKDEPQRQFAALKQLKDKTRKEIARVDFDINIEFFQSEIDSLINECNSLKMDEDKYRNEMSELKILKIKLEAQVEIVKRTHDELSKDYHFALQDCEDYVGCPTCGAKYSNSFVERFEIAKDTETCRDLLTSLSNDLAKVNQSIADVKESLASSQLKQNEINLILAKKQGEVTLKDLIQLEGKRKLFDHLNAQLLPQEKILAEIEMKIETLQERMQSFDDPEHRKNIAKEYGEIFSQNAFLLNVSSLNENAFKNIDCNIDESGSDMPRAILAYFYTSLSLIKKNGNATFFPVIIDAPNQQEQDKDNLEKMLKFIRNNSKDEHQLILGLVDDCDLDYGGEIIELKEKNYLLKEEDYQHLSEEIRYYESMNLGLTEID